MELTQFCECLRPQGPGLDGAIVPHAQLTIHGRHQLRQFHVGLREVVQVVARACQVVAIDEQIGQFIVGYGRRLAHDLCEHIPCVLELTQVKISIAKSRPGPECLLRDMRIILPGLIQRLFDLVGSRLGVAFHHHPPQSRAQRQPPAIARPKVSIREIEGVHGNLAGGVVLRLLFQ